MFEKIRHRTVVVTVITLLTSGCATLEDLALGSTAMRYDPTKVYLQNEFVTVSRTEDMDRFVCLSGPLQCDGFGLMWDCACFRQ
jgi:hypothetical protein